MTTRRVFAASAAAAWLQATAATDPADLTVSQARALLAAKKLTPVELVSACLKRIERLNAAYHALITVLGEEALATARALKPGRGVLHGIPVVLKDLYDTAGVRTTAASRQWADRIPARDATVVTRLKQAGAIVLGKANMDEFAYNYTGETSAFGVARNPWNRTCSPGGSSGGSAVAVSTGMALAALGSDTGGSIRFPASLCGITGYKPSYGLLPAAGVAPLAWSLDHVGPMTRTAQDARLLMAAMGAPVPHAAVKGLRIGVARKGFFDDVEGETAAAIEEALRLLGKLAAGVREVVPPEVPASSEMPVLPRAYSIVIVAEAYAFHRSMLAASPEKYHPQTRASIESGARIATADYIDARRELEELRATARERLFGDCDVIVTPTSPGVTFPLGTKTTLRYLGNTAPWNLYGLPAISVCGGFSAKQLPIGLQITGAPGRDDQVLALAEAYEEAAGFHLRRPPV
jgi:aspartyl-tRNA(Asn)/glutamyl-tRNA(Gln) amidotransferase subunit A